MYTRSRGFMKDMDKTTLLKMRDEEGMSINEMVAAVGCSKSTLYRILGPMPPEERVKRQSAGGKKGGWNARKEREGGYTVERKAPSMMPQREAEPVKAVLAVKKAPIRLSGAFMHYTICPGREMIDVETEEGRTLIQVPADMLGTFIEELTAIQKNINTAQSVPFWG